MFKIAWIKGIIYLLLIVVPIHFSVSTPYINDVKFLDLAVFVFIIWFIYLFIRLRRRTLYILWDKIDIWIYLYATISGIGVFLSDNPVQSARNYFLFFAFLVLFYMTRNLFEERDSYLVSRISLWVTTVVSLYAIAQFYGYYIIFVPNNIAIMSFFGNQNFAANFVAINIPFILGYFIRKPLCGGILFAVSYAALIMFGARGALLGFVIGYLFFFWWIKKKGYSLVRPLFLSILIILVVTILYSTPNPLNQRKLPIWGKLKSTQEFLAKSEAKGSIYSRLVIWRTALLMIKDHPIKGVAPGRFGYFYPFYQEKILEKEKSPKKHAYNAKRAHNEYLQVFAETGIFGFFAFILILGLVLKVGIEKIKTSGDLTPLMFTSSILAFLGHSLFSFPMHLAASMLYFSVFVGFIIGKGKKKFPLPSYGLTLALYFFLILVATFMFTYSVKAYVARIYLGKGKLDLIRSTELKDPEPLIKEGYRKILLSHYFDPYEPLSTFYIAKIYQYGKRYKKAIEYYEKFLKMYSDYNAFFNIGDCYFLMGDTEKAITYFEKLRRLKPDYEGLYYFLGISYMKKKDYKNAVKILREGLIYEENKVPIYINLAIAYRKLGEIDKAIKYLEDAKKIDPDNKKIDEYLERLKREIEGKVSGDGLFEIVGKREDEINKIKRIMGDIIDKVYIDYGIKPKTPFSIIITSTSSEFEEKTGISGLYGGVTIGNTIYLKPIPLIEKYQKLRNVLLHEYAHIVLNSMGGEKPLWVQEGFALYLSGVAVAPEKFKFIPLSEFPDRGYDENLYYNAYLKIRFLIERYGIKKVVEFLKKVDYYNEEEVSKEIFGISFEELDKKIENRFGGING